MKEQEADAKVFCEQMEAAAKISDNIVIIGDMNLNSEKWDQKNYNLHAISDLIRSATSRLNLRHIKTGPTFTSEKCSLTYTSTLDHCFVHEGMKTIKSGLLDSSLSDHLPLYVELSCQNESLENENKKDKIILKRCYRNFDHKAFNNHLASLPWEGLADVEDVDEMATAIEKLVTNSLDIYAPMKEINIPKGYNSDLSQDTKKLISERDNLRKTAASLSGPERHIMRKKYKTKRNLASRMVKRDTRGAAQKRILEAENSTKELWNLANRRFKKKSRSELELLEKDRKVTSNQEVADVLNKFFVDKIDNLKNKVNTKWQHPDPLTKLKEKTKREDFPHFDLKTVNEAEVIKAIKGLKPKGVLAQMASPCN